MISIKGFTSLPEEQRKFVSEYLDRINSFQFEIKTYRGQQNDLPIQNTDLWIESYIEIIPDLQEFRDLVLSEMQKLGINKHPYYTYRKEYNHFYISNKREIEQLQVSLNTK